MLTGYKINEEIRKGGIKIDPYNPDQVNPNSYNVCLGKELLIYTAMTHLDPHSNNNTASIIMPDSGILIYPGRLYLGVTQEYTESWSAIPMINGRSSLARLGLVVHQTGGFGDIGFCGHWTLEFSCIHSIRLYPGMQIAQICWFYPDGEPIVKYNGKYNQSNDDDKPISSRFHREVKGKSK